MKKQFQILGNSLSFFPTKRYVKGCAASQAAGVLAAPGGTCLLVSRCTNRPGADERRIYVGLFPPWGVSRGRRRPVRRARASTPPRRGWTRRRAARNGRRCSTRRSSRGSRRTPCWRRAPSLPAIPQYHPSAPSHLILCRVPLGTALRGAGLPLRLHFTPGCLTSHARTSVCATALPCSDQRWTSGARSWGRRLQIYSGCSLLPD